MLVTLGILSLFIKMPVVRVFVAFLIWGAILGNLSVPNLPRWRVQQFTSKRHLEQIYAALISYKNDHGNAFPEHLSQLVPDYIPRKDLNYFSDSAARAFKTYAPNATIDVTEVDRHGAFEYFGENGNGMLAANRNPIEENRWGIGWKRPFRMVLEADGKVQSVPEKEYQRRLLNEARPIER